jgi:trehalose 6-phosphate phosphatase
VVIESKPASIALHYRLAPDAEARIETALRRILEDGPDHLILCRGRKVFEIVPAHVSKGAALETLMALPDFRGRRPVMVGDDISDETAFVAVEQLGGCGLKVAGEHFSRAEAFFSGPADVRAWLATLSRTLAP